MLVQLPNRIFLQNLKRFELHFPAEVTEYYPQLNMIIRFLRIPSLEYLNISSVGEASNDSKGLYDALESCLSSCHPLMLSFRLQGLDLDKHSFLQQSSVASMRRSLSRINPNYSNRDGIICTTSTDRLHK